MSIHELIPLNQHVLWPYWLDAGYESSANNLVAKNWGLELNSDDRVQIPARCAVYMFETKQGTITWYRSSNLVSVEKMLYCVFYEHNNVLGSYAWLAGTHEAEYLTVKNASLSYVLADGILTISGMHIDRRTGVVTCGSSFAKCVGMRPPVAWHTKGFNDDLETTYRRLGGLLSSRILRIQRWSKTLQKSRKKSALWVHRNLGWFDFLSDDLFATIIDHVLTVSRPRHLQCKVSLLRPEAQM